MGESKTKNTQFKMKIAAFSKAQCDDYIKSGKDKEEKELRYKLCVYFNQIFFTIHFFGVLKGPIYEHSWHIELIIRYLQAVEAGDIKRLIINVPPRSMKTLTANSIWSAWLLCHDPHAELLSISHGAVLVDEITYDTSAILQTEMYRDMFQYFNGVKPELRSDKKGLIK